MNFSGTGYSYLNAERAVTLATRRWPAERWWPATHRRFYWIEHDHAGIEWRGGGCGGNSLGGQTFTVQGAGVNGTGAIQQRHEAMSAISQFAMTGNAPQLRRIRLGITIVGNGTTFRGTDALRRKSGGPRTSGSMV